MNEIALHDDHCPAHFLPPYTLTRVVSINSAIPGTSCHVKPISVIIASIHELLDCFLNMEPQTLRSMPISTYSRLAYPVIVLTKLHISSKTPASHVGSTIDQIELKLGYYLDSLVRKLQLAAGTVGFRAPLNYLGLFMRLQAWCDEQKSDLQFKQLVIEEDDFDSCWMPSPPKHNSGRGTEYGRVEEPSLVPFEDMGNSDLQTMSMSDFDSDFFLDTQAIPDDGVNWWIPDLNEPQLLGDADVEAGILNWQSSSDGHHVFEGIESGSWNHTGIGDPF